MGDATRGQPDVHLPLPAYNSVWQLQADAWNSLEEATDRLLGAAARGVERGALVQQVDDLLELLDPSSTTGPCRAGTTSWSYASCSPETPTTSCTRSPPASLEPSPAMPTQELSTRTSIPAILP